MWIFANNNDPRVYMYALHIKIHGFLFVKSMD